MFERMITLVRYAPETNRMRFYNLSLHYDLFDGVALIREWGSLGQAGRVSIKIYPDEQTARAMLQQVKEAKEKRGYQLKEISTVQNTEIMAQGDDIPVSDNECHDELSLHTDSSS